MAGFRPALVASAGQSRAVAGSRAVPCPRTRPWQGRRWPAHLRWPHWLAGPGLAGPCTRAWRPCGRVAGAYACSAGCGLTAAVCLIRRLWPAMGRAGAARCCATAGLGSCVHPLLPAILCFVSRQHWHRPVLGCADTGRLLIACVLVVGARRKPCCLANDDDVLWAPFPSLEASVVAPSFPPSADLQGENLVPAGQAAAALSASQPSSEAFPLKILGGIASLVLRVVVVAASSRWRWNFLG